MNEQSITIRWEKNADGGTDISVNGDINYQMHFREAFLSLDNMSPLHDITERETSGESAGKSATIAFLTQLIGIIRKSDKTNGRIISEQIQNSKFSFTDLVAIRKFNEQKFRNRREFREYFGEFIREKVRKENGDE